MVLCRVPGWEEKNLGGGEKEISTTGGNDKGVTTGRGSGGGKGALI